jgi:hypothetical protein
MATEQSAFLELQEKAAKNDQLFLEGKMNKKTYKASNSVDIETLASTVINTSRQVIQDIDCTKVAQAIKNGSGAEKVLKSIATDIANFNNGLTEAVKSDILQSANLNEATLRAERWLHVADLCVKANDFQSAIAIGTAFGFTPITRLNFSQRVSPDAKQTLVTISEYANSSLMAKVDSGKAFLHLMENAPHPKTILMANIINSAVTKLEKIGVDNNSVEARQKAAKTIMAEIEPSVEGLKQHTNKSKADMSILKVQGESDDVLYPTSKKLASNDFLSNEKRKPISSMYTSRDQLGSDNLVSKVKNFIKSFGDLFSTSKEKSHASKNIHTKMTQMLNTGKLSPEELAQRAAANKKVEQAEEKQHAKKETVPSLKEQVKIFDQALPWEMGNDTPRPGRK